MTLTDLSKEELLRLIARLEESHLFRVTAKDIARVKYETKREEVLRLRQQAENVWKEFTQVHSLELSKKHQALIKKSQRAATEAEALLQWIAIK